VANPNPSPATRFARGNRANPGGKPKLDPDLVAKLRAKGPELVDALIEAGLGTRPDADVRALIHCLDRILGPVVPVPPLVLNFDAVVRELEGRMKK